MSPSCSACKIEYERDTTVTTSNTRNRLDNEKDAGTHCHWRESPQDTGVYEYNVSLKASCLCSCKISSDGAEDTLNKAISHLKPSSESVAMVPCVFALNRLECPSQLSYCQVWAKPSTLFILLTLRPDAIPLHHTVEKVCQNKATFCTVGVFVMVFWNWIFKFSGNKQHSYFCTFAQTFGCKNWTRKDWSWKVSISLSSKQRLSLARWNMCNTWRVQVDSDDREPRVNDFSIIA